MPERKCINCPLGKIVNPQEEVMIYSWKLRLKLELVRGYVTGKEEKIQRICLTEKDAYEGIEQIVDKEAVCVFSEEEQRRRRQLI